MTKRTAILVTGSRDWPDPDAVWAALGRISSASPQGYVTVIHGACTGADNAADTWCHAARHFATALPMPAPWKEHGKSAGPRRNAAMVHVLKALRFCGYECHVLAFPLGKSPGTRGCMKLAEDAGFAVVDCGGAS